MSFGNPRHYVGLKAALEASFHSFARDCTTLKALGFGSNLGNLHRSNTFDWILDRLDQSINHYGFMTGAGWATLR